jgi:UV DNA damage endonuclease
MKIGYPCINRSIGCTANRTFRLASYSEERLVATVAENLACLRKILAWNHKNRIRFFRITSDLVPFASHPVCTFPWQDRFHDELAEMGEFIRQSGIRISMHPDQFIVLNAPDERVVARSIAELVYQASLLDGMGLDSTAKIQLHLGGVYGDAEKSIARFVRVYDSLDPAILRRLVIENDDQRFTAADCLQVHADTGVPVLFDVFHHSCRNRGEEIPEVLKATGRTWKRDDGIPMVDYSSQHPAKRAGSHADHIDSNDFQQFLRVSQPCDIDIMLEIKDKEASAKKAVAIAQADPRFS